MNIRLINITRDSSDLKKIKKLYLTAFPSDERAPFGLLVRKAKKPNISFFSCHDGETWIGFIYVINHIDLSYLYYFAVDDTKRGKGYGTANSRHDNKARGGIGENIPVRRAATIVYIDDFDQIFIERKGGDQAKISEKQLMNNFEIAA